MKTILKVLPGLLTAIGAFLIGKNFLGQAIDESFIQEAIGIVMALVGAILSVLDHSATVEKLQAVLRQTIVFVGGVLVAAGKLKADTLETISSMIITVVPFIYGYFSRKKTAQLDNGQLQIQQLKQ